MSICFVIFLVLVILKFMGWIAISWFHVWLPILVQVIVILSFDPPIGRGMKI